MKIDQQRARYNVQNWSLTPKQKETVLQGEKFAERAKVNWQMNNYLLRQCISRFSESFSIIFEWRAFLFFLDGNRWFTRPRSLVLRIESAKRALSARIGIHDHPIVKDIEAINFPPRLLLKFFSLTELILLRIIIDFQKPKDRCCAPSENCLLTFGQLIQS